VKCPILNYGKIYSKDAVKLDLKESSELEVTISSERQFLSAIVFGTYESLKTSLSAYGIRNLI